MNIRQLFLTFVAILIVGNVAFAHANVPASRSNRVYANPTIPSTFVGGSNEMINFIVNTLQFPQEAIDNNISGLVVYMFVVEPDGTLSNFELVHRAHPLLEKEALRILKAMPPWSPAQHNGRRVRSEAYVPMFFQYVPGAFTGGGRHDFSRRNLEVLNQPIFTIVDKMPEFASGADIACFISRVLRYPQEALQAGIQGRVICSFIVGYDGAISNIEVISGDEALREEAIRIISVMPRWTPGERNGQRVNVRMLLPIDFVIEATPTPSDSEYWVF